MFEFPWVKARKRREAEKAEADRIAKLLREEREQRAARILAEQIERSRRATAMRWPTSPATVTPIKKPSAYELTAKRAAEEDRRQREAAKSTSIGADDYAPYGGYAAPRVESEVPRHVTGHGGTFDGAGASGDWSSSSSDSSSSDSGSSSSDSGSSGGSD